MVLTHQVTPRVGVWIETQGLCRAEFNAGVTPRVGVWIETQAVFVGVSAQSSLPAWECGLKRLLLDITIALNVSHSPRGSVD